LPNGSESTPAAAARAVAEWLRSSGLALCKPDPGEKKPTYPGWPTRSLEPDEFAPGDLYGIIAGPLSDGNRPGHALIIVDLDTQAALEKADLYLPPTGMIEGRPSKPRSHRYYLVPLDSIPEEAHSTAAQSAPAAQAAREHPGPKLRHFADAETGKPVIDFVGTGGQCVCPPSAHPSGEVREWVGGGPGEPAVVAYPDLWGAVCRLAEACGWKPRPAPKPAALGSAQGASWPDDVRKRAVAYLKKCPPAVSGHGGHKATFWAARAVVWGFDLGVDAGFELLRDVYNPGCDPPWTEAELWHKCEDAGSVPFDKPKGWLLAAAGNDHGLNGEVGRKPDRPRQEADTAAPVALSDRAASNGHGTPLTRSADRPAEFSNYVEEEQEAGSKKAVVRVGKTIRAIGRDLDDLTGGWPKRVDSLLFVPAEDHQPLFLENTDSTFAWIGRQLPERGANALRWAEGHDKVTTARFFAFLTQTAERYDAVEGFPHYPPLPRHYYMHPEPEGGDGKALSGLLERFRTATLVDADLIRAFFLSLLWGGEPGQRPAWLFTAKDDDPEGGRGVGKSRVPQLGSRLVGGHIDASANEKMQDLLPRLLSPAGLRKRVLLLDNVKTLRFSWAELEGLVTGDVISGKRLYAGEGQRPNTLTYCLTLNGASLSRDLAQRCVIVKLERPAHDGDWERDTIAYIEEHRWAIIGDILAALRRPAAATLKQYSRWGPWEKDVLARVPEPEECRRVIAERQADVDEDAADADLVRDAFAEELARRGHRPDREAVWMPSRVVAAVVNGASGEHRPPNKASAYLRTLAIAELRASRRGFGRGWVWRGKAAPAEAEPVEVNPEGGIP
jgi:hypothetical protein